MPALVSSAVKMLDRIREVPAQCAYLSAILDLSHDLCTAAMDLCLSFESYITCTYRFSPVAVAAVALYIKSRELGQPRTLSEVSRQSGRKRDELANVYYIMRPLARVHLPITLPEHISKRICHGLGLSAEQINIVDIRLAELKGKSLLTNYSPDTVIAAVINEKLGLTVPAIREIVCSSGRSIYDAISVLRKNDAQ